MMCSECGRPFFNCCDDNEYCAECLHQVLGARLHGRKEMGHGKAPGKRAGK